MTEEQYKAILHSMMSDDGLMARIMMQAPGTDKRED